MDSTAEPEGIKSADGDPSYPAGDVPSNLAGDLGIDQMMIDDIIIGEWHRRELGDIDALAESIRENGLIHPIVVTPKGELLAGLRRLEACKKLGWRLVTVRRIDPDCPLRIEADENAVRKSFTPSEAVEIGGTLEPILRKRAQDRQREGGRSGGKASGKLPEASKGETRELIARAVGLSASSFEKVRKAVQAGEENPEKSWPIIEEMDRTGNVDGAFRAIKRMRQEEEGRARQLRSDAKKEMPDLDHKITKS